MNDFVLTHAKSYCHLDGGWCGGGGGGVCGRLGRRLLMGPRPCVFDMLQYF